MLWNKVFFDGKEVASMTWDGRVCFTATPQTKRNLELEVSPRDVTLQDYEDYAYAILSFKIRGYDIDTNEYVDISKYKPRIYSGAYYPYSDNDSVIYAPTDNTMWCQCVVSLYVSGYTTERQQYVMEISPDHETAEWISAGYEYFIPARNNLSHDDLPYEETTCSRGHIYNKNAYSSCPECEKGIVCPYCGTWHPQGATQCTICWRYL